MAKRMKSPIKQYLSEIGSRGGKAGTGQSKARTKEQAQKAVAVRWAKVRAKKKGKG